MGWVLHDMRDQAEPAAGETDGAADGGDGGWTDDAADGGAGVAADGESGGGDGDGAEADNVIPIKGTDPQEQEQQPLVIEDDMPLLQRAFRTVAPH